MNRRQLPLLEAQPRAMKRTLYHASLSRCGNDVGWVLTQGLVGMQATDMTTTPKLVKVEDHEGSGECGLCGRTGLRWIAVLDNGAHVGMECAKKVMGWRPAPANYAWVADFDAVAEYADGARQTFILWQCKTSAQTRETLNGSLMQVGGARQAWERRGWLGVKVGA